jgi:urease accessory protein
MLPGTLVRLLQLASPALPVGAYSYSQGLERAVEDGIVRDEAGAANWIEDALILCVGPCEGGHLVRMLAAWTSTEHARAARLNQAFLATRETAELRAESVQMGHSMARLLPEVAPDWPGLQHLAAVETPTFPFAWSAAAAAFGLSPREALTAYLWAWLESQVMAAVKLVPLGQSAGQRMLARLGAAAESLAGACGPADDDALSNFAPGLALASCRHETQYSRLFRS